MNRKPKSELVVSLSRGFHPLAIASGEGDRFGIAEAYLATKRKRRGLETVLRNLSQIYLEEFAPERMQDPGGITVINGAEKFTPWNLVPWHGITAAAVDCLISQVDGAPAYVRLHYAALRGLAKTGYKMEVVSTDTFSRVVNGTSITKGKRLPAGRDVSRGEYEALLRVCAADPRPSGRRDAALIAFAWQTGARREELVNLATANITGLAVETSEGTAVAGTLVGKGDKERDWHLYNGARSLMLEWLALRGAEPGPVFCRTNKAGEILLRPMSTTSAHRSLMRRARQAGIEKLSLHDFRRTLVGDLLDKEVDLVTVSAIVGHSSVATTAAYDRRGKRARQAALAKR